jgi:tetratricopeptide (TPR) repeat protein
MPAWSFALALSLSQAPPSAPTPEELLKKLDGTPGLQDRAKPFEISASLTRLYFSQGRTKDAQAYARDALASAKPALEFYAAQKKQLGAQKADPSVACSPEKPKDENLANTLEVAQALAKAKKTAAAVTCARKALTGVPEVMLLDGHLKFLSKDLAGARASYDEVLARFDDVPDALYARGALTLDEKPDDTRALEAALADLDQFLTRAPQSSKARHAKALKERADAGLKAGGLSKLAPVAAAEPPPAPGMPVLDQATIAAFQNAPKSADADARYAKLIEDGEAALAKGRYQDALDGFKQVMPYQPDNPRLRAGMAWSLIKLGKPMADNVWRVATQNPAAVDALGDRLKQQGDVDGAKALWARLAEAVPEYAPKLEAKR